jgi:hypothetical protein
VSDYRLDDRDSVPGGAVDLSCSLCVQSSCEAHPSSYPMVRGVVFSGVKRGRGVTLTIRPYIVLMSRMSRGCTSCRPWRLHGVAEQFYFTSHAGHVVCILCMQHPPTLSLISFVRPNTAYFLRRLVFICLKCMFVV